MMPFGAASPSAAGDAPPNIRPQCCMQSWRPASIRLDSIGCPTRSRQKH